MTLSARAVVEATYEAWAARDLERTLHYCADDIAFNMHVPQEILPFGGVARGKAELRPRLQAILDGFDTLAFAPDPISIDGDRARAQVLYYHRHKPSGEVIDGRMRHLMRIADGKIAHLDEYHDVARIAAFMRMVELLSRT